MTIYFVVILTGIALIFIALIVPKPTSTKPIQEDFLDSVSDTIQQLVQEMEEENKQLLRMIGEMRKDYEKKSSTLIERIELLENRERETLSKPPPLSEPSAVTSYTIQETITTHDKEHKYQLPDSRFIHSVKSKNKELFELYENGKSIEYIAKKMGKNKGEVQLIISLARQEEPQHGR